MALREPPPLDFGDNFGGQLGVHGRYPLPTKPGLGFEVNEATLKRYPFQGTRPFPPAFQEDGSLAPL